MSFCQWDGVSAAKNFIGIGNYLKLLRDPMFWLTFQHNVLWMILSISIPVFIGLLLASLVGGKIKGRTIFRTVFFMPAVISFVAVAIIWGWIYHPIFGSINVILRNIGLGFIARGWLGDPIWALPSVIIAASWTYYGFCMVIFVAALEGIDQELYDAAKIDGANAHQCFWFITIPQLRNTITLVALITMMNSFKVFDVVYVMTEGGPFNKTEVIATYLFKQAFRDINVGYGCTLAVSMTVIIFIIAAISISLREKER